ncbi:hypothetical protein FB451DRAFT_1527456 [Mycena latifolia]|nr:hypothetical protein FB451DRAFT_1527456 [Mycena latifolia]
MSLTKGLHFARRKVLFNVFMPANTLLSRSHTDVFGPQRRPWKFWDMHVPETAWDYERRWSVPYHPEHFRHSYLLKGAAAIPDSKLPEPWSCNWRAWGLLLYWHRRSIFSLDSPSELLMKHLEIDVRQLLMFRSTRSDNASLIFVGQEPVIRSALYHAREFRSAYYFYDAAAKDVYRFGQAEKHFAGSAEDFIACADWNNMTHLGSVASNPSTQNQTRLASGPPLHLHDLHNAQTPWAPEPRVTRAPCLEQHRMMAVASREWGAIPDTHLPAPWSCDWSKWDGWSWGPQLQDDLRWRFDIPGRLNPIMFHDSYESLTTLFESRGIFYLLEPEPAWWDDDAPDRYIYRFPVKRLTRVYR